MKNVTKTQLGFALGIITLFAWSSSADAKFGVSLGNVGVRADTRNGVGVSLPSPQLNANTGGNYGLSTTVTQDGIYASGSGPHGVSVGTSSNGDIYGGVTQTLPVPGGPSVSGQVDNSGVSASGDVALEPY